MALVFVRKTDTFSEITTFVFASGCEESSNPRITEPIVLIYGPKCLQALRMSSSLVQLKIVENAV